LRLLPAAASCTARPGVVGAAAGRQRTDRKQQR
jgi:hypothetical protein